MNRNQILTINELVNSFFGYEQKNSCETNIEETDKSYNLYMQLPGFKKDEINIEIQDEYLLVSGDSNEDNKNYISKKFSKESFENKFKLCDDIDINNIEATMEDGILTINLNKKNVENTTKTININIK
jgi:HSP20 family protein